MSSATRIKIKTESLPKRCEVCHQQDRFDARSGYCRRCTPVTGQRRILVNAHLKWTVFTAILLTTVLALTSLGATIFPDLLLAHFPDSLTQWLWPDIGYSRSGASILLFLKRKFISQYSVLAFVWLLVLDMGLILIWIEKIIGIHLAERPPEDYSGNLRV